MKLFFSFSFIFCYCSWFYGVFLQWSQTVLGFTLPAFENWNLFSKKNY